MGSISLFSAVNSFDAAVMTFVQEHFHNPVTDTLFPILTYLGEGGVFWILLALILLFFPQKRRTGIFMLCAMGAGFLLGEVLLKNLVCRPRPFQQFPNYCTLLISPPTGYSFPSGHTCSSLASASVLLFTDKKLGIPALILAILIAFSRIFLFVHWPSDVLLGALLGICCAVTVVLLYESHSGKAALK